MIVRLSIHQTSILVSSIAKRFLVILKYRRTESIVGSLAKQLVVAIVIAK